MWRVLRQHHKRGAIRLLLFAWAVVAAACSSTQGTSSVRAAHETVGSVFANLAADRVFPISESSVRRLLPGPDSRRLKVIAQVGGHDLHWADESGTCFITFMVERDTRTVRHMWAKCASRDRTDAQAILRSWLDKLAPVLRTPRPELQVGYSQVFADFSESAAVDISIENVEAEWLTGIGLRSGVLADSVR